MYSCSLFHYSESQILEVEPIRSASYVDICQLCAAITISKENAAPGSTASLFTTPGNLFVSFQESLLMFLLYQPVPQIDRLLEEFTLGNLR